MNCTTCNDTGSIPASGAALATGNDDNGADACPDCTTTPWRPCFAPLEKYLSRHPHHRDLPWEYMGHDISGFAHYRERERNYRVVLCDGGWCHAQ